MKKNHLFSTVFFLFLLTAASITRAQTVSSQKGLTTAVFNLQQGKIKIYLPDDIRPGDVISGTVVAEPEGKNEKQIEKNLAALKKYLIGFNNEKFPVSDAGKMFQFLVQPGKPVTTPLQLINASDVVSGQVALPTTAEKDQQPASGQCNVPSHALTGSPLRITGPFDGNASNTSYTLDNKPVEILAESPRQCIVTYPANAGGNHTLSGQENGKPVCSKQITGVDMDISAGKLNLQKGETTFINVNISGLQNLPDTALLTLTNISTDVITMADGNNIAVTIPPPADSAKGTYTRRFNIQSIKTGSFLVAVHLNLSESGSTIPSGTNTTTRKTLKCDCICVAKIETGKTSSNKTVYKANVTGSCSGMCGTGTTTFTVCANKTIKYAWTIKGDKKAAGIVGAANNQTVMVSEKNKDSAYTVVLTATTECDCNGSCSSSDAVSHPGTKGGGTPKDPTPKDPTPKDPIPPTPKDPIDPGKELFPPHKDSLPPIKDSLPPLKDSIPKICECKECRVAAGSRIEIYLDEDDIDPFSKDSVKWYNDQIFIAAPVIYSDCPDNCKPRTEVEIRTSIKYDDYRYPAVKTDWQRWPKFGRQPAPKILYKGEMLIEARYKCFCDEKLCGEGILTRKIYFIETNKCCDVIRKKSNGRMEFSLNGSGKVTILGNTLTVNISPYKPEPFTFPFNLEAIFCNLDDNQIYSLFTSIMQNESYNHTSILMDRPVDVPGITPYYGLTFMKQVNGREIGVYISVYKNSCVYDVSVFYADSMYEYAGPPFLKPADILRMSFNMGDANTAMFWTKALSILSHLARVYNYNQEAAYTTAISNYLNMLAFGTDYLYNRSNNPSFKQKLQALKDAINELRQRPNIGLIFITAKLISVSNVMNK